MSNCFLIQPFDGDIFDKRFRDVLAPAVRDADLEPYRVDQDPGVSIPIEAIERGIREAAVCLAEITTDNPNVWFELGYALACNKEVVMVCATKERGKKFPFDVQHRSIISYGTDSSSDFEKLREAVAVRLRAIIKKGSELEKLAASPLAETEGLNPHEVVCLTIVMENSLTPNALVWPRTIEQDMGRAGYTSLATSLALRNLLKKGMLEAVADTDRDGEPITWFRILDRGENWLLENQDRLVLQVERPTPATKGATNPEDEIPF